jgi:ubiquinone/menaquinone biosynthesis C-methylase UbiE
VNEYVLRGGVAGAERLRLLARVMWPTTEVLLRRVGLAEGMTCLDVGCGIGEVTLELARWVGPHGKAVGIDLNEQFLQLSREEAKRRGLAAEFQVGNAADLHADKLFDLAYARFLLTHLPEPHKVLEGIGNKVRRGGLVVIEDIDFAEHFCRPDCPAFARYVELYQEVVRQNGGDACIGPRLTGLFADAGLREVQCEVVQPTFRSGEGKRVAQVTMEHIRQSVVAARLASHEEIDRIVASLDAFAAEPQTLVSLPRIFQVWGRR